jgi:hypothetical protein
MKFWKSEIAKERDLIINYQEYININQSIIPAKKFAKYKGRAKFMIEQFNKQIETITTYEELIRTFELTRSIENEEIQIVLVSLNDKLCKYEIPDDWTSKWLKLVIPLQKANQNIPPKSKKKVFKKSNSKIHPRTFQLWLHRTKLLAVKKDELASNQYNEEKLLIRKKIQKLMKFPKAKLKRSTQAKLNPINRSSYNSKPPTR